MDWISAVPFFESEKFQKITSFLKEERKKGKTILPEKELLLRAFTLTPFNQVKVVVLGQDPYPNEQHACGLAFSVPPNTNPLPKSLINIYKELDDDVSTPPWNEYNGDLARWAEQGVLLLNTSLSVVAGEPGSHSNIGWGALTNDVLRTLNEERENLVFLLWGRHAQNKGLFIDTSKHLVINSAHPSPLSANKGFFGSKPFSKTNRYLQEKGLGEIEW